MQLIAVLVLIYLAVALIVFPIWALLGILKQREALGRLSNEVERLNRHVDLLRREPAAAPPVAPIATPVADPVVNPPPPRPDVTPPIERPAVAPLPPPIPIAPPAVAIAAVPPPTRTTITPPPTAAAPAPIPTPTAPPKSVPSFNLEQFLGAKLFAWAGGAALFLGVAFFVKYSFEHNLIPPEVRVAIGFLLGAGLIVGGLKLIGGRFTIAAQSLIATGVVSLYAVTFACNAVYHFAFFGLIPTFALMSLITAVAFLVAVRVNAQVVAVLGLLGGFLTPKLLSTGEDHPLGLFGYIALLNLGLAAVALHRRWNHLVALAAGGTVLTMIAWADRFYTVDKTFVAMAVAITFSFLFILVHGFARRRPPTSPWIVAPAACLPLVGYGFALLFLGSNFATSTAHAAWFFAFVFLIDGLWLSLAWRDENVARFQSLAGGLVFLLLTFWTARCLTDELLPVALVAYLIFAAAHTAFPLLIARRNQTVFGVWDQAVPALALVLALQPILLLDSVSFLVWPAILLVDLIAIGLALVSASLAGIAAVLVLTLLATSLSIFKIPGGAALDPELLLVVGGFAIFFFLAGRWLVRRLGDQLGTSESDSARTRSIVGGLRTQIPVFSALLPFLLLIMVCAKLSVPDPSMVFGLGLLLTILILGLVRQMKIEWLAACALAGIAGIEYAWHGRQFDALNPTIPLLWYLGFHAIFSIFPFVFQRRFVAQIGPWAVASLAGAVQFPLVYRLVLSTGAFDSVIGLLPALFALPPLLSLAQTLRRVPANHPKRLGQLAWFGGVALLFVTLIFPIQFERQWITVSWALEGAALIWLYRRVPHAGLRGLGTVLLAVVFVRLAANPAVFHYTLRGDLPILNWYLYAYGVVIASLFAAARWLKPSQTRLLGLPVLPAFYSCAVLLLFQLLNIEIADFFTLPGTPAVAFRFSGGLAQDTTYTIAWSLFALGLLAVGIWKSQRAARIAAITLLIVALLKLFFHDLASLHSLYRIGALVGVAVIAFLASFAYQRFLPVAATKKS